MIVDECVIVGLSFGIDIGAELEGRRDGDTASWTSAVDLRVTSGEAAIPWDALLSGNLD